VNSDQKGTILKIASEFLTNIGTRLLTWVLPCPTSIFSHIESRPNLELASGNCELLKTTKIVEEEEEAVFIRGVNTNEDPSNAHQAQHRPVQATGAMSA